MEDLEFNAFYRALQSQYQALFDRAQDECWLVCVPVSSSLPPKSQITYTFAEAHLLEPSRMLRDEYNALVGGKRVRWQLSENRLKCPERNTEVEVIAEELAYNRKYNQYKMFIVSCALTGEGGGGASSKGQKKNKGSTKEDLLVPRRTLSEHIQLLRCFSRHEEILSELKKRITMFNNSYMILEDFLMDASSRLEVLLKNGYSSYIMEHREDERARDRRIQEGIWLAVESVIMNDVHSKVYPMVCSKYNKEDKQFAELSRQLKSVFTPTVLEVSSDYHCPYPITLSNLRKLPLNQLPLEKLFCLQKAMDSIYEDVSNHFKSRLRVGEPSLLQSDDLIPLMASILVQANLKMVVSDVNYIEMFHWSPSESDKLSYVLVTVRAAVEYVRGQDARKYLPTKPRPSSPPSSSSPYSSSSRSFSSPLLDQHDEISHTLSKLSSLKLQADSLEKKRDSSNEFGYSVFGRPSDNSALNSKHYDS